MKPPYGRITAIDLNTGEHKWMQPVGDGPRDHPTLRHLDLATLGLGTTQFPTTDSIIAFRSKSGIVGRNR